MVMLMNYYKRSLINLFVRVQEVRACPLEKRRNCLGIQEDLLRRVVYVEKRIKQLRAEIRELKGTLSGKGPIRLSRSEAQQVKGSIQRHHSAIEQYRETLYLFKSVGDALAFIYFSKWDIKPMSFKEDAGYLHGKEGLWHELNLLRMVFEVDGAVAILNDLTNSLRYGDLMIASKGYWGPLEAKTGHRTSRREKRQLEELEKMHRYLIEDRTQELYGIPGVAVRSDIVVAERDHVDDLNDLIRDAYKDGFAFAKVEEGLYYWVVVGGHPGGGDFEDDKPASFDVLLEEFKDKKPMFFFVNETKFDTQGRYPYTLSIRDPRCLFDFYAGRLLVHVIVDVEMMSARFRSRGFELAFDVDENIGLALTTTYVNDDRFNQFLSRHFVGRLAYEFLSLEWLVEETTRRTALSALTEHELSGLQVAETDRFEHLRMRFQSGSP